jgi:hypothetical protein
MTEVNCRYKRFKSMAIRAGCGKSLLVIIRVTGQAFGSQTKVCELFILNGLAGNIFRFVAIRALSFRMGTRQNISCQIMIKLFGVKTDDLKIEPMMVIMAGETSFSKYL